MLDSMSCYVKLFKQRYKATLVPVPAGALFIFVAIAAFPYPSKAQATYTISGNAGVAGATMTLSGASSAVTSAMADGAYAFSGLANGLYVVSASEPGYNFLLSTASVTIAGADVAGVDFTATVATPIVLVSWDPSATSDVVGYNLYRGSVSDGDFTLITPDPVTGTTFVDTDIIAGRQYYYFARAVDINYTKSVVSNQASAYVPPATKKKTAAEARTAVPLN